MKRQFLRAEASWPRVWCLALVLVFVAMLRPAAAITFSNIYAFGDSGSDAGNAYFNPPYWNGRHTNGPNWVDHLAGEFGISMSPSNTGGNNYAVGGATTAQILYLQVPQFSAAHAGAADPDALYAIWAGANDGLQWLSPTFAAANIADILVALNGMGAELFVVATMPDLSVLPATLGQTARRQWRIDFDGALTAELASLEGMSIFVADFFTTGDEILAAPAEFGFTDWTHACWDGATVCSTPDSFLWFDRYHLSTAGTRIFADSALTALPMPGDYNQDRVVDARDYDAWKAAYGSTVNRYLGADGNGDGVVDAADYVVWRDSMYAGAAAGSAAPLGVNTYAFNATGIPEPSAVVLLVVVTVFLAAACRPSRLAILGADRYRLVVITITSTTMLVLSSTAVHGQGQILNLTLTHAGQLRSYDLFVPSGYTPGTNTPLVFNLHGGGRTSQDQMNWTGMNTVAEREGFLTVYPNAVAGSWYGPNGTDAYDDAGFFDAMIADLAAQFSVDVSRIYVTGLSEGALMTFILTAARPYTFAAAAPVAAERPYVPGTTTYAPLDLPATPGRPFPLLDIHGTGDQLIPYIGGGSLGWVWPPIEQVMRDYAQNNGAESTPIVVDLPNTITTDSSTVQLLTYGNPDDYLDVDGNYHAAETLHYRIVGGGHNWPDMVVTPTQPERWPPVNRDINANDVIWDFFSRHVVAAKPMPGDYNGDAVVDAADYDTWRAAFGSTLGAYVGADGNGNGVVDAADYVMWRDSMYAAVAAGSSEVSNATIPEPATWLLLACVSGLVCMRRTR